MSAEIPIVLIDDHTIVRNGLRSLIEVIGAYKVVGEYDNGLQFINALTMLPAEPHENIATGHAGGITTKTAAPKRPEQEPALAIIDVNMPEMNGMETVRWLRKHRPEIKVLILSLDSDEMTVIELFKMGVRGYLPKNCTAEVLKKAIEDILVSGYYHSDLLHHALVMDNGRPTNAPAAMDSITDRELLFIKLLCDEKEYTYDQIKDLMNVHRRTVDGYREALFDRFNVKSKTGLVLYLIKHRIIKL